MYDAAKEVFIDVLSVTGNGQQVLDAILQGQNQYHATSDITRTAQIECSGTNFIEAVQGDAETSFVNQFGGEVFYDNYKMTVNEKIGSDKGARAEFGFNCKEIEEDIDMSDVVTRIIPVAYNGYTLEGETPWVDSPYIGNYPIVYKKKMEFKDVKLKEDAGEDEQGFETLAELREELIRLCKEQFQQGVDKPKCNYSCDMYALEKTEEYKHVKGLEMIGFSVQ